MPLSYLNRIKGLVLKSANTTITVADGSVKETTGKVEDAIVRIEELEFLIDFVVVDMENEGRIPLILGRPFMRTSRMAMRIHDGIIILKDQEYVLMYNCSKGKKVKIKERDRHKKSRREVA